MTPGQPNPRPRKVHPPLRPLDAGEVARATDIAFQKLVHEMASLVDGSLRYLRLAERAISRDRAHGQEEEGYLHAAGEALTQVAALIRDASGPVGALSLSSLGQSLSADRSVLEIIEHAADVLRPLAGERGVEIHLHLDDELADIALLPIYPVIANGIKNAIEATGSGGIIDVRSNLADAPCRLELDILDTGEGPPEQQTAKVFDPGFSTKRGSTGLGLAICQDIVDELGGMISLGARPEGGARLSIRLPIPEDETTIEVNDEPQK
ncbi:MAG: ATP-binding protein [Planctomycetota bacterium]